MYISHNEIILNCKCSYWFTSKGLCMFLFVIGYVLFALCLFTTLYVLRTHDEPNKLHNWEIIMLVLLSAFWLPELITMVISFALMGPMLFGVRYLRRKSIVS